MFAVLLFVAALPLAAQTEAPADAAAQAAVVEDDDVAEEIPEGGMPRYIFPETPEERMKRLGTHEDPGINPDSEKVWIRFGKNYTIHRFDKAGAVPIEKAGWIRPHGAVSFEEEIYQENEKYVWVWIPELPKRMTIEERRAAEKYTQYSAEALEYLAKLRPDYEPFEPPVGTTTLRFEESSAGLPQSGSWRNSLAVADMNGDGFVDLVVPSQRGAQSGTPTIFLGDGTGKWSQWQGLRWPGRLNYGSVAAADFDKDGKMDLAFGVHLDGVYILRGDGKGLFQTVHRVEGFPTRRIVAADVDADGWTDVVAIYEGPITRGQKLLKNEHLHLRAWMNRSKGTKWEGVNLSGPREGISGDWLTVANLNGDGRPDFVGSSIYFNATHTHYLSSGKGTKYEPLFDKTALIIPARGTYHAVTAAPFSNPKLDDSIVASVRSFPSKVDPTLLESPPLLEMVALDRISFAGGQPVRKAVARYPKDRPIYGLASGDFDGDGKYDVIYTRNEPREAVILTGDGKGGFLRAKVEGLALPPERNYDIEVADVNGDKRPDLIFMYESAGSTAFARRSGKIQVFLNRGTE